MPAAENIHTLTTARPPADQFRLAALRRYDILDTPPSDDFAFLAALAARVCGVPYAFISLVDAERVWVKASFGLALAELPRQDSICALAVQANPATEIADLRADFRTAGLPLVARAPRLRLYSAVTLDTADGHAIGALCVMDTEPGLLTPARRGMLAGLARQAMALIEARANARALAAARGELEQLSTTDALTGLHNRRSLRQRLDFEAARARRYRSPLSVVLVDIDHLGRVNDEHGQAAGDQVLAAIGRLVRESVRVIDVPGRHGDGQLCVILPNTPADGAGKVADNLRARIAAQPHYVGPRLLPVTASVGVGVFDHMDVADADSLLRQAEAALRHARDAGPGRTACGAPAAAPGFPPAP